MVNLNDLLKRCVKQREKMLQLGLEEKWFHKEDGVFAFIKPGDFQYECFIIAGRLVYWFLFSTGKSDFVHVTVRRSSKTIMSSGPVSAEIFCGPQNLRSLTLKEVVGHHLSDEDYWKQFFKAHEVNA